MIPNPGNQAGNIESLRMLLERLGSSDVTIGEAKVLRTQLDHLLKGGTCTQASNRGGAAGRVPGF
ncbi:hypothetical protein OJF2_24410 [Aquisphaera giovannonii]|uniref:Uncharacterized protein n=1 Tax=Aquisphaera giovannonii TaxID=406548 RepID=A0A5B9W0W6_9BACT|nr:hypothetical protein [Aquisphaera giovannonii]QEH33909.1 hypothetical protein OJF2_24410 [Aquisphaera giovannonii]